MLQISISMSSMGKAMVRAVASPHSPLQFFPLQPSSPCPYNSSNAEAMLQSIDRFSSLAAPLSCLGLYSQQPYTIYMGWYAPVSLQKNANFRLINVNYHFFFNFRRKLALFNALTKRLWHSPIPRNSTQKRKDKLKPPNTRNISENKPIPSLTISARGWGLCLSE